MQTKIENGLIEGNYDTQSGLQIYLGIPFAQPPVGQLRWKAPQPVHNWTGVRSAKKFGPRPIQANVFGDMKFRSDGLSEDCLYLNVWTPAKRKDKNLPVLLYFYGGGFVAGDGSEPRYDGASMARKGIVVVTCNYRLNIFGFFAHPDLSKESPYHASGNYGLLDQVAALRWVQKNIAAFGGDPRHVTIAGESAGSISVSYQMASPLSKGLFSAAIGESGAGINPTLAPVSLQEAEQQGVDFVRKAGVSSLEELRKMSTRDIYELYTASRRFGFPVVIDHYFLPATLPEIFARRAQSMVPLLAGWNSAEIPGQAFMQGQPYTEENFISRVKKSFPDNYQQVLELYPHKDAREVELSATRLASDQFIVYSTWKWAELQATCSDQPVYRYLFSRVRPPLRDAGLSPGLAGGTAPNNGVKPPPPIGAPHASEIEYCLGNLYLVNDYLWTEEDYKVSASMEDYFANFIRQGNPNGKGLPEWPVLRKDDPNPAFMQIDVTPAATRDPYEQRFRFLDQYYQKKKQP